MFIINFLSKMLGTKVEQNGQTRYYNRKGILICFIGNETDYFKKAIYDNNGSPLYMENASGEKAYWKYTKSMTTIIKVIEDGKRTLLKFNSDDILIYEVDHNGEEFWY